LDSVKTSVLVSPASGSRLLPSPAPLSIDFSCRSRLHSGRRARAA
jgi:hypothetical protein